MAEESKVEVTQFDVGTSYFIRVNDQRLWLWKRKGKDNVDPVCWLYVPMGFVDSTPYCVHTTRNRDFYLRTIPEAKGYMQEYVGFSLPQEAFDLYESYLLAGVMTNGKA